MPEINADWTKVGSRCPAFLARQAESNDEHTVYIEDAAVDENIEGTYITMVRDDDGGVLLYDDGVTVVQRVVEHPETLTKAFKDAVGETVRHYFHLETQFKDLQVEYSPGYNPLEFDIGRDVEVKRL